MNISLIVIASKTGVFDDLLVWINADVALAVADSLKTLSKFVQLTLNNTLRPLCSVIDGKDGKSHKKEKMLVQQVFFTKSAVFSKSKITFANNFGNCFEPGLKETNPENCSEHCNLD